MSGASKKLMGTTAAGGGLLAIEDVFSTYLYTGQSAFSVVNGIDMETHGGAVWIKNRTSVRDHRLFSTGLTNLGYYLAPNLTSGENNLSFQGITSFNSDGWSVGTGNSETNNTGFGDYTSWTFRKAPRFFDVVTYTGNGTSNRQIAHNLNTAVGSVIIKQTSGEKNWGVWHRSFLNVGDHMYLNTTGAVINNTVVFGSSLPTDSNFNVGAFLNTSGQTFVAYLFAHDPLGPSEDGSDGLIACGSYTGNGSADGPEIDLGWEPQWVLVKRATVSTGNWFIFDTMRGLPTGGNDVILYPNASNGEAASANVVDLLSRGFKIVDGSANTNASGSTYIYIAIRRGPMRAPTSATEVFALQQDDAGDGNAPAFRSGFPVDFALYRRVNTVGSNNIAARLTGTNLLDTDNSAIEGTDASFEWDYMNGWNSTVAQNANTISYMWKRAPQFCDVVAYTGNGTAGRTVSHNLGVAPEMMWIKQRDASRNWSVYHTGTDATAPEDYNLRLDLDGAAISGSTNLNSTAPTSSNFTLGSTVVVNETNGDYIAYLFASLPGISKVGSYTGDGTDGRAIDCGFTAGARFVLIKRTNLTGSWNLWDSVRGIISGNDPYIELDTTDVEVTTADYIDPHASGFAVNNSVRTNISGVEYLFYAIA
jgi:hypothetical protein